MRKLGLSYVSKVLDVKNARIRIELTPSETFISIAGDSDPLYQFFTTGKSTREDDPLNPYAMTPGYVVGVKYDRKTRTLKGLPLGSTLEQDASTNPRWKYSAIAEAAQEFLPYKVMQIQAIPLHVFYPNASPKKLLQNVWTSPIEIGDSGNDEYSTGFQSTGFHRDRGYDAAPMKYTKAGRPVAGLGLAPDADWYRRSAINRVESEDWGARNYYLLTDTSGILHVYQGVETDDSLSDGSLYLSQAIKTNVPEKGVVRVVIPTPGYARQYNAVSARDAFILADGDYDPPHTAKRWEFNSTGTRMASVMLSDSEPVINGVAKDYPEFTGVEVGGTESSFGMQEFEIVIKVTGEKVDDFTVDLVPAQEVPPSAGRCIVGVGYYWGDIKDLHPPTGVAKDTLIAIEVDVFHKPDDKTDVLEPTFSEEMAIVSVKEFATNRVIESFVSSHVGAPLGLRGEAKEKSLVKLHLEEAIASFANTVSVMNVGSLVEPRKSVAERITEFINAVDALTDAPGFESTPAKQSEADRLFRQCSDDLDSIVESSDYGVSSGREVLWKKQFKDMQILKKRTLDRAVRSSIGTIKLRCIMLAYDLRVLGFAVQKSYFHDDDEGASSREDRVTVRIRGEVKYQTPALPAPFLGREAFYDGVSGAQQGFTRVDPEVRLNPSDSLLAYRALYWNGVDQTASAVKVPYVRTDFNVDYPVGRVIYRRSAAELMSGGLFDIFCVHPHGHWSIKTMPVIYYPKASKYMMPGSHALNTINGAPAGPSNYDPTEADAPDPSSIIEYEVDIVSVVVVEDGSPKEVVSSHLDLFNEAYERAPPVKFSDFRLSYDMQRISHGSGFFTRSINAKTVHRKTPINLYARLSNYEVALRSSTFDPRNLGGSGPQVKQDQSLTFVYSSAPASYLDSRAIGSVCFGRLFPALSSNQFIFSSQWIDYFLPVGRGACMFTRKKEIKA